MMNLKYQFYKGYYDGFDPCWFKEGSDEEKVAEKENEKRFGIINDRLFDFEIKEGLSKWQFKKDHFGDKLCQFELETTYPGLVSGTGYTHETGNVGEFKIGFHFDHTAGLPMLPGHSVKGTLRAAFPQYRMEPKSSEPQSIKIAKAAYIIGLLGLTEKIAPADQMEWVTQLELQIFGTSHAAISAKNEDGGGRKKPAPKDIFLDAMICKADKKGKILGPDSITPHSDKVWENPTPLLFLKVLPEVQWRFSFLLSTTKIKDIDVTAAMKEKLFKDILLDMGIGAKSNVGYGHFIDPDNRSSQKIDRKTDLATNAEKKYLLGNRSENQAESETPKERKIEFFRGTLNYKKKLLMDSIVVESGTPNKVQLYMKEDKQPVVILNSYKTPLKIGQLVEVWVQLKKDKTVNGAAVNYKKIK